MRGHLVGILDTHVDVDDTAALTPPLVLQFWLRCGVYSKRGRARETLAALDREAKK